MQKCARGVWLYESASQGALEHCRAGHFVTDVSRHDDTFCKRFVIGLNHTEDAGSDLAAGVRRIDALNQPGAGGFHLKWLADRFLGKVKKMSIEDAALLRTHRGNGVRSNYRPLLRPDTDVSGPF
jgi:hypothetical protein